MAIKKIIHLCWLSGDDFPDTIKMCVNSWKNVMPDYEIIFWDKEKFLREIKSEFALQALKHKKWAFATDYMRLFALYNYGGIYLDSDVLVYKTFDGLLDNEFFSGIEYFKPTNYVAIEAAIMGAVPHHPFFKDCLSVYDKLNFDLGNGTLDETPITIRIAKIAEKYGFRYIPEQQNLSSGITIYPPYYFTNKSGIIKPGITYAIHLCEGSWRAPQGSHLKRLQMFIKRYWRKPHVALMNIIYKLKNHIYR